MERFQAVGTLADAHELDGYSSHAGDREGSAATGIAVHLGHDQAGQLHVSVETLSSVHRFLPGHGIYNQEYFIGFNLFLDVSEFLHQFFVDLEASAGVDDGPVHAQLFGLFQAVLGNFDYGCGLGVFGVHRNVQLLAQGFKLLDGSGAAQVGGDQ